jgi:DnaK suppressor protein
MNKKELEKFKKLLDEEKAKIMTHLEELSESAETELTPSAAGDPVDIASLEINQTNLSKIGKRETYLLKKIDLALGKIAEGTYGECEMCGEEINKARLMARPVAQLCIDCKTEQESQERKFSSRSEEDSEDDDIFAEGEEP